SWATSRRWSCQRLRSSRPRSEAGLLGTSGLRAMIFVVKAASRVQPLGRSPARVISSGGRLPLASHRYPHCLYACYKNVAPLHSNRGLIEMIKHAFLALSLFSTFCFIGEKPAVANPRDDCEDEHSRGWDLCTDSARSKQDACDNLVRQAANDNFGLGRAFAQSGRMWADCEKIARVQKDCETAVKRRYRDCLEDVRRSERGQLGQ